MASDTHRRAKEWTREKIGGEDVGSGETFHLRDASGRRVRVAGRHIEGRQTDWSVVCAYRMPLLTVVRHHRQPGRQGCRLMIRGDDSWRSDPSVESLA